MKLVVIKQLKRSCQAVLYIFIICIITAFFCMSLNLYQNSRENIRHADETYSTIAVMELYGNIDQQGNLVNPNNEACIGWYATGVSNYDLSAITKSDCVERIDLRSKYGAYIPGQIAREDGGWFLCWTDHIRFRIKGDEPISIKLGVVGEQEYDGRSVELEVLDSAAGIFDYGTKFSLSASFLPDEISYYTDHIRHLNAQDNVEELIFYPDTEYFMVTGLSSGWEIDPASGKYKCKSRVTLYPVADDYGKEYYVQHNKGKERMGYRSLLENDQPFPIQLWDDIQEDDALLEYYTKAAQALRYTFGSFTVTLTNDVLGVPAFHLGSAQLYDGRFISEEEYISGARVCMISRKTAELQGWSVGDCLPMEFYVFDAFPNNDMDYLENRAIYHKGTPGFFQTGEYEIVGIYDIYEVEGNSSVSEGALAIPWTSIYIPEASLGGRSQAEKLVHGGLLTIWLKNGRIDDFMDHVNALGITEHAENAYQAQFTFYDQGYSIIQPSLQATMGTAKLLVILSTILLVVVSLLMAWFFAQSQKQTVGIYRMLGGTRRSAVGAILLCAIVMALIGSVVGVGIGWHLTDVIGDQILKGNLQRNQENADFRAYVLSGEISDTEYLSVTPRAGWSMAAGCAGFLFFPVLTLIITVQYSRKEPRALLPQNKA